MNLIPRIDFGRLKEGLAKTRNNIINKLSEAITRKANIDEQTIEELEEALIGCDLGTDLTEKLIANARKKILSNSDRSLNSVIRTIKEELKSLLVNEDCSFIEKINNSQKPYVLLIVGINGSGKTTTVGKLAYLLKTNGLRVIIGSADTFRAAANDQLKVWAERAQADLIDADSGDPASVAFSTVKTALEKEIDVVLIDTAGRLHSNKNLMNELKKIKNVVCNLLPGAPHDTFLVIDGNSGLNAVIQANEFSESVTLSGLIVTKLDGTAKGGTVFQICNDKRIPVKFVGVGEGLEDLQSFSLDRYLDAIFSNSPN